MVSSAYTTPCMSGCRISLRSKVSDSFLIGTSIIDPILPIGRGQRQSISGDRYTGKTPSPSPTSPQPLAMNNSGPIDGYGPKRSPGPHVGSNQNPSKSPKSIPPSYYIDRLPSILSTHSPPPPLPPPMIPSIGVPIAERLRDRGYDSCICFDDLSKHSRSYRQPPLLQDLDWEELTNFSGLSCPNSW